MARELGLAAVDALAQRAGPGVARVGERREALRGDLGVERVEGRGREVDLAAHLDQLGHRVPGGRRRGVLGIAGMKRAL